MNIAQIWDICLQFEYDKRTLFYSLDNFLSKFKNKKILDCACGTGFLTLDLIKKGHKITCSDGSKLMLKEFKNNAKKFSLKIKPHNLKWSNLPKKFNNDFDLILCRGCSLIYASAWDESRPNQYKKN